MLQKSSLCLFTFFLLIGRLAAIHVSAQPVSLQTLDSAIFALNKMVDSVKADNQLLKFQLAGISAPVSKTIREGNHRRLYHIACFSIILLLSLSIMFLTAYVLFKKLTANKYDFVDF